jgi:4-hydroxy-tetrahydrodipicolinate synthase
VLVALWLPHDADGVLDRAALAAHLAWLRGCGISGVMALGSSACFPLMDTRQRVEALEAIAELAGPLPVIANISDMRPGVMAQLGRAARQLGLAGVAVMPPAYYPLRDPDQLAFFEFAAESAGLPVLLYNFPELTGNRIAPETIAAFADRQPLAGFKQSGGEFAYHEALIRLGKEKGFAVFSGSDTRLPEVFALGASGCIGGLVNLVPEYMVAQFKHFHCGVPMQLEPVRSRMVETGRIVDQLAFPLNVAAGVAARGWETGTLPGIVSAPTRTRMEQVVAQLRSAFAEWGLPPGPSADSNPNQTPA